MQSLGQLSKLWQCTLLHNCDRSNLESHCRRQAPGPGTEYLVARRPRHGGCRIGRTPTRSANSVAESRQQQATPGTGLRHFVPPPLSFNERPLELEHPNETGISGSLCLRRTSSVHNFALGATNRRLNYFYTQQVPRTKIATIEQ